MKPLKLVLSLFSSAETVGYVPPSLLFQHGHGCNWQAEEIVGYQAGKLVVGVFLLWV